MQPLFLTPVTLYTHTHARTCVCAVCASCLQAAELRKKNSEYQKRSRGTFFSGEYLDWLEAQQQDLLETASNGLLSSLSCASSCSCPIEGSQDGEEPVRVSRRVGGWVHTYVRTYVRTCTIVHCVNPCIVTNAFSPCY